MKIIQTKTLTTHQYHQIDQLWNREYPIKLKDRFGFLLHGLFNYRHYLIEDNNQKVLAWAVDFEKEGEIRFSILVDAKEQGKGYGKLLLDKLKENLDEFYGWVIDHNQDLKADGDYYQSQLGFYQKLGFEILDDERIDNEMLKAVKIKYKKHG